MENRLNIAWISTFPPVVSGLSHYSQVIADYIDSTFEHIKIEKVSSLPRDDMKSISDIKPDDYNRLVYNIGNHPYNEKAYSMCIKHPGTVILHDLNLHDLIFYMTYARGDFSGYVSYLLTERGMTPDMVRKMASGSDRRLFFKEFPMLREIADSGSKIMVHSFAAERFLKDTYPQADVERIPMYVQKGIISRNTKKPLRIGIFGFMDSGKYIEEIVRAYSSSGLFEKLMLVFAGTDADTDIVRILEKYGVREKCEVSASPDDDLFEEHLRNVFAAINLRRGAALETSANMLKLMSSGKCVAAFRKGSAEDYEKGSFYEIDENRIQESLGSFFSDAANSPEKLENIGESAGEYTSKAHDISFVAEQFASQLTLMPSPVKKRSRKTSAFTAYRYLPPRLIISDIRRRLF